MEFAVAGTQVTLDAPIGNGVPVAGRVVHGELAHRYSGSFMGGLLMVMASGSDHFFTV